MSKDNKKLIWYLGIIFIAILLTYKLPHNSNSIIQYVISPIRVGNNSVFYLSGIIPLVLLIIGISGLFKLERFRSTSKLLIFITIILLVIPAMNWVLDFSRTNYHWIKDDGLMAVDIEKSNINLNSTDEEMIININLELRDYGRKQNNFKIRVYLPEGLSAYTNKEYYDLEACYHTHGGRNVSNIKEEIIIKLSNGHNEIQPIESQWFWEDTVYELYNSDEKIKITQHGL